MCMSDEFETVVSSTNSHSAHIKASTHNKYFPSQQHVSTHNQFIADSNRTMTVHVSSEWSNSTWRGTAWLKEQVQHQPVGFLCLCPSSHHLWRACRQLYSWMSGPSMPIYISWDRDITVVRQHMWVHNLTLFPTYRQHSHNTVFTHKTFALPCPIWRHCDVSSLGLSCFICCFQFACCGNTVGGLCYLLLVSIPACLVECVGHVHWT